MNPGPPPPMDFPMHPNGGIAVKIVPNNLVIIMNVVNCVTQMCLGGVVFASFMIATIFKENSFFNFNSLSNHIFLCVSGYVILISQAILTFNPYQAGWAHAVKYPQKKAIHWVMQTSGSILALAGAAIKLLDIYSNFRTTHGILGFVALVLTFLNLIGGVVNLATPSLSKNICVKAMHGIIGATAILFAYVSLCFAFHTTGRLVGDGTANMAITLTVFAMIGIIFTCGTRIICRMQGRDKDL